MDDITDILINVVIIFSAGISLFFALLCLVNIQGVNKSGNRWLGIFMLCIFFLYIDEILMIAGMKIENTIVFIVLNISAFTLAPIFYYTVSYFITPDRLWKTKDYFHLFSFALLYLLLSSYLLYEEPLRVKQGNYFLAELVSGNFGILYCLQMFYYCISSWIKLKKHEKNILLFNSTIENIDLKWLRYIVIYIIIMFCCVFIKDVLNNFSYYYVTIINLLYLFGFFFIARFSIQQKEIYPFTTDQKNEIIYSVIKETSKKQIPKRPIEDGKLQELKIALLHVMENKKPFLDRELNLVKLAAMMDISSHQLSYLINAGFNENFYQFINRYRIEEAKKFILDESMSHLSFQGIGLEVGFKSRSVFNTTFKKCTGQTPSEYKTRK
ncbi:MAG TPA: helix-turn-helix domain-containing protein [Flavobacterium sp.]|jgi:AraC-like DNA-binding protein